MPATPPVPSGFRLLPYADIDDPQAIWRTYDAAVGDDPSGLSPRVPYDEFRASWWRAPSHRLELGHTR